MNSEKKKILGILLLIFFVIIVIALCLSKKNTPNDDPITKPGNTIEKKNGKVDAYEEFLSIQATVNDINNVGISTSYVVKEVYLNSISNTYYYFVKCCKFDEFGYEPNVYLLLIVDNNNFYELHEINEQIDNLELYAKNYEIEEKQISSSNKLLEGNFSAKNILIMYLEYFKQMLIYDSYTAYNMLYEDTKQKYLDYNDFKNNALNIYENLSSEIFSLNLDEQDEQENKIYKFEDNNRNKIVIYEEDIMNFKISY